MVRLLDADDLSEIAILADDIDGTSAAWKQVTHSIQAAAEGKSVIIEFVFDSDNFGNHAGWLIDDVCVDGPK